MGFFKELLGGKKTWAEYDSSLKLSALKYVESYLNQFREVESTLCSSSMDIAGLPLDFSVIKGRLNNNASEFEKITIFLAILRQHYMGKQVPQQNFNALCMTVYKDYADQNSTNLVERNFGSPGDFFNNRFEFYTKEIELLLTMDHPHAGAFVYRIYDSPLQTSEGMNQSAFVAMAFVENILMPTIELADHFSKNVLE